MSGDRFAPTTWLPACLWFVLAHALCSEGPPGEAHPPGCLADCIPWRDKTPRVRRGEVTLQVLFWIFR